MTVVFQPSGTVTLVFSDIEGSTRLLHELGAEAYRDALVEHRAIVREAYARYSGYEVDYEGDAFFYAFSSASDAVNAVSEAMAGLEDGPIRIRVGIHTGEPVLDPPKYVGMDVHFAARVMSCAHGGQVVVSHTTASLLEESLIELGEHRLKDIAGAVPLYQRGAGSFPPLKTISNTNLPRPASALIGRKRELAEVVSRIEQGARLVTFTGPGGTGKTRLALEAASSLVGEYKAGVFWVGLASLRDPALVSETIAQTLGAKDSLASHIQDRELVLLLDNLEHVIEAAPELSELLSACPNLTLLVTSRELLRVQGEVEYAVPPLATSEALELFCARSQLEPTEEISELCARLDLLPLAVELAAARTKALTPGQILERLSSRLDLLRGGRDADPRQQTLRATIEWSYDFLSPDEQELFARLAVFAGGCTLEAAVEVADADLDTLQSLVEKSLLRFTNERYWMLETIREYAAERLKQEGVAQEIALRHAGYFRTVAAEQRAVLDAGDPEEGPVSVLSADIDNLRAAVDLALGAGETEVVRTITASLYMFWIMRGLYSEGRSWLKRALALDETRDETRRRLLSALAMLAYEQGDYSAATAASDEAAALSAELGGATEQLAGLREQAAAALMRGELEKAERLFTERLDASIAVDNGVATSSCRLNLVSIANKTARPDRAEQLLAENLLFVRSKGQARCEAYTLAGFAETAFHAGRPGDGAEKAELSATRALQIDDRPLAVYCLDLLAAAAAARGDDRRAAALLGATEAAREAMGVECDEDEEAIRAHALGSMDRSSSLVNDAWTRGRTLDLAAAVDRALASID
ncbi:MAG TPA: adenylate/guanylate cyclase domain-containing protein [Gaiellaceae bacterium]|nr:adenylate/guanylate cyclase domain-containing protein [Gaiellaceae bacterium]